MTIRELRQVLFTLNDQNMTVDELRHMLFMAEEQDAPLELHHSTWLILEAKWRQLNTPFAIAMGGANNKTVS